MLNKGCHLSQGWIVLRSPQELRDLRAQMAGSKAASPCPFGLHESPECLGGGSGQSLFILKLAHLTLPFESLALLQFP